MSKVILLTSEQQKFLDECEELYKDRYTDKDEEFAKLHSKEPSDPPIVYPWSCTPFSAENRGNWRRNNWRNDRGRNDNRRDGFSSRADGNGSDYDRRGGDNFDRRGYVDESYERSDGGGRYRNDRHRRQEYHPYHRQQDRY